MPHAASSEVEPERLADVACGSPRTRVDVERESGRPRTLGGDVAEHESASVTVGRAAAAVADRARDRSGRLRADAQRARRDPRDRSAARADRVHLDHRQPDVGSGAPVPEAVDLRLRRRARGRRRSSCRPCRSRRSRRRRRARGERRADHAAGRTGPEQRDRAPRDVLGGHDAAVALHDQQRRRRSRRSRSARSSRSR